MCLNIVEWLKLTSFYTLLNREDKKGSPGRRYERGSGFLFCEIITYQDRKCHRFYYLIQHLFCIYGGSGIFWILRESWKIFEWFRLQTEQDVHHPYSSYWNLCLYYCSFNKNNETWRRSKRKLKSIHWWFVSLCP